jgi:hypothetical protein
MLRDKLKKFKAEHTIIEVTRRPLAEDYIICHVRAFSDDLVQLIEYNRSGKYDGMTIIYSDDISDILWKSKAAESISKLLQNVTIFETPEVSLTSMSSAIRDISKLFKTIEIHKEIAGAGGQFGEIVELDREWLHMNEFTPPDNMSRYHSLTRIDNISKISVDTLYLNNLERLYLT